MYRKKANVQLRKGIHELRVRDWNHGGPYLRNARIQIRNPETDEQVPLFCYGSEIERFLGQPIGTARPIEVSGWQPVELNASR